MVYTHSNDSDDSLVVIEQDVVNTGNPGDGDLRATAKDEEYEIISSDQIDHEKNTVTDWTSGHHISNKGSSTAQRDTTCSSNTGDDTRVVLGRKPTVLYNVGEPGVQSAQLTTAIIPQHLTGSAEELENIKAAYRYRDEIKDRHEDRYDNIPHDALYQFTRDGLNDCVEKTHQDIKETFKRYSDSFDIHSIPCAHQSSLSTVRDLLCTCDSPRRSTVVVGVDPSQYSWTSSKGINEIKRFRLYTRTEDSLGYGSPNAIFGISYIEKSKLQGIRAAERLHANTVGALSQASEKSLPRDWREVAIKLMPSNYSTSQSNPCSYLRVENKFIDWLEKQPFNFLEKIDTIPDDDPATYDTIPFNQ
ncbi:uncharacterized protein L199_006965 [Kwoniella botswanensis]|uniref:uncharacterized protein n=1 Tax=Kwoniella botswanensis TaxID=1268659 RepID=UPI00315D29AB